MTAHYPSEDRYKRLQDLKAQRRINAWLGTLQDIDWLITSLEEAQKLLKYIKSEPCDQKHEEEAKKLLESW